jgi:anti-sigma regulatory factor (Ser/Thr protein kinase)
VSRLILDVLLENEPKVVTAGRRQLASLVETECAEAIADVSLVVSELLANAVEHHLR